MENHILNYPMESNSQEKKTLKLPIKHAHTKMDVPSQLQTHSMHNKQPVKDFIELSRF